MNKESKLQSSGRGLSGESVEERRIAPGRVTRTGRLDMGRATPVQRKEGRADTKERAASARSGWDWTMDPFMDAAHRGGAASEESESSLDTATQRQAEPSAEGAPESQPPAMQSTPAASAGEAKIIDVNADEGTPTGAAAAPSKITIKIAMRGGGVFVATSEIYTFEAIALQTYGQAGEYSTALRAANPQIDPKKIFPGKTQFNVPRMAVVEDIVFPEAKFDSTKPLTVPYGQHTFDAEGAEGGPNHSRTPHVPSENSGVTLGRGFDMSRRKAQQIYDQLVAAGVPTSVATTYKTAAGKKGESAKQWVKSNTKAAGELTLEQQHKLFVQEYGRQTHGVVDYLTRIELAQQKNGDWTSPIDFQKMDSKILELLIDMQYLGDLKGTWGGDFRKHVIANDTAKVAAFVRDSALRASNHQRYAARCKMMGVAPKAKT